MSQFNFNIMDSAGYGYYRVWTERSYLLKLAFIPFLIKFACTVAVFVLGLENNILRQGLILFPGILAEGWVLAQFLRTLLGNERWPTIIPEDIDEQLLDKLLTRARGIVAATLVYGLVALTTYMARYLVFGLISGNFETANPEDVAQILESAEKQGKSNPINPLLFIPLIGAAVGLFWAFRLMWIYIPFSVLMPARDYLKMLGGMLASAKMMVLFFCTLTPVMFLTLIMSRFVYSITGSLGSVNDDIARFIVLFFAVFSETLVALISTAAFVWAMRDFLPKHPDVLKELPKLGDRK